MCIFCGQAIDQSGGVRPSNGVGVCADCIKRADEVSDD